MVMLEKTTDLPDSCHSHNMPSVNRFKCALVSQPEISERCCIVTNLDKAAFNPDTVYHSRHC